MIASFAEGYFKSEKSSAVRHLRDAGEVLLRLEPVTALSFWAISGDKGGRQVMKNHPEELWIMETEEKQLWDVDLPEDLKRGKKEYGTGA